MCTFFCLIVRITVDAQSVACESPLQYHTSNVFRNVWTAFKSIPPPSGSTASMQRAIAMIRFESPAFTQTRPFIPTAASSENLPPSNGSRKCFGSRRLEEEMFEQWGSRREVCTHFRHIFELHFTTNPPFSSPKPSALRVCASKHSSSGSISLCARENRAYTKHPTYFITK